MPPVNNFEDVAGVGLVVVNSMVQAIRALALAKSNRGRRSSIFECFMDWLCDLQLERMGMPMHRYKDCAFFGADRDVILAQCRNGHAVRAFVDDSYFAFDGRFLRSLLHCLHVPVRLARL